MSFVRRVGRFCPSIARGRSFCSNGSFVSGGPGHLKQSNSTILGQNELEFAATFSTVDLLNLDDVGKRPIISPMVQNSWNLLENSSHFRSFSTNINDFKLIEDSHFIIEARYDLLPHSGITSGYLGGFYEILTNGVCVGMDGDSESDTALASFDSFAPFLDYDSKLNAVIPIDNKGNRMGQYYKHDKDTTNILEIAKNEINYPSNAVGVLKRVEIQFKDWIYNGNKRVVFDFKNSNNIVGMCSGKDIITFKLPTKRNKFLKLYSRKQFEYLGLNRNGKILNNMVGAPFLLSNSLKDVYGRVASATEVFDIYGGFKTQAWIGLDKSHIIDNWIKEVGIVKDETKRILAHSLAFLPGHSGAAGLIQPGYQACVHHKTSNPGTTSVSNVATLVDESVLSTY